MSDNHEVSAVTKKGDGAPVADTLDHALEDDYAVPAQAAGSFALPVRILTALTALFMFSIMGLTLVDVLGRYLFNSPVDGGVEFIEFLLGFLIFSALPLVTVKRAHITVELFDGFMSNQFRRVREIFVLIGSAGMIGFMTERMWSTGVDMMENDDISLHLEIPTAPILFVLTFLSAVSMIVQLYMVWKYIAIDYKAGLVPAGPYGKGGSKN